MVLLVFLAAAGIRTVWTARRLSPADNARDAAAERPAMEQQDAAEAMQLSREAEKWESLSDGTLATENDAASGKDETVYVLAGPDGAVRSIIVNEQLRNPHGTAFLDDYSQLRGIENVNGYQTFTRDRDGKLIWEAGGKDISYQGTTDKALPVDVSVTYFLNGKETAPADLAGRSGQIRIRFDYTNHETRIVEEQGSRREIFVPFTAVSGAVLPGETFRNVAVTNGKLITEGKDTIALGVAVPGLRESLDMDDLRAKAASDRIRDELDKLDIPSYVEITADVTDFSLDRTMTLISAGLLQDLEEIDDFDTEALRADMDDLQGGMDELLDGGRKFRDGTEELRDGTKKLRDGSEELRDGAAELRDGTLELKDGTKELRGGALELYDGVSELLRGSQNLKQGTGLLAEGASALRDGADSLKEGTAQAAENGQLLDESVAELLAGAKELKAGTSQISAQAEEAAKELESTLQLLEAFRELMESHPAEAFAFAAQISAEKEQTEEELAATWEEDQETKQALYVRLQFLELLTSLFADMTGEEDEDEASIRKADPSELLAGLVQGLKSLDEGAGSVADGLSTLRGTGTEPLAAGLSALDEGAGSLRDGIISLDSGAGELDDGANKLNDGIGQLHSGAYSLHDGIVQLDDGAGELLEGMEELADGAGELTDGARDLDDGAGELTDGAGDLLSGLLEMNDDGISMLTKTFGENLPEAVERLKLIRAAGAAYRNFAGALPDENNSVKFIVRTSGIGTD